MKKIQNEQTHPNDVPVIFLYDANGQITGKISVNEWKKQKQEAKLLEELEIKLYREAITYYGNNECTKAEDLLTYLIARTDYTHYEYVERLANIYRRQGRLASEKRLLLCARKNVDSLDFSEGIIRRIDKRLTKLEEPGFNTRPLFN
ncbi:hypothetical protein IV487_00455 [Enterococcus saccharolyticus]|uniref:Uncharacterized protein n=1 Tax=Candidatus Enterococcus willemsii TaxID=1857215 RepID=A0ABQ6YYZ7_9ENTE|nr:MULTISPECIES: hypothetical protein [Enterococcus]KAF1302905.1 hypothetical protein BAU17_11870 [Enterococcus sp. CU12B]MCD5000945.1 hypothetical protein [Enterococcus saccharolyticus]